jgi:hypothetical protein
LEVLVPQEGLPNVVPRDDADPARRGVVYRRERTALPDLLHGYRECMPPMPWKPTRLRSIRAEVYCAA